MTKVGGLEPKKGSCESSKSANNDCGPFSFSQEGCSSINLIVGYFRWSYKFEMIHDRPLYAR